MRVIPHDFIELRRCELPVEEPVVLGGVMGQVFLLCNRWDYIEHWRNGEIVAAPPGFSAEELRNINGACDPGGQLHGRYKKVPL